MVLWWVKQLLSVCLFMFRVWCVQWDSKYRCCFLAVPNAHMLAHSIITMAAGPRLFTLQADSWRKTFAYQGASFLFSQAEAIHFMTLPLVRSIPPCHGLARACPFVLDFMKWSVHAHSLTGCVVAQTAGRRPKTTVLHNHDQV